MTNGLVKGRKTIFVDGYAVQWFPQLLRTKVMIYVNVPNHNYVCISEMTLPYIATEKEIESIAKLEIQDIENSCTTDKCKYCVGEICVNADCPIHSEYCPVPYDEGVCRYEERIHREGGEADA